MERSGRSRETGINKGRPVFLAICVVLAFICAAVLLTPSWGAAEQKGQAKVLKIGGLICLTGWFSSMDVQMGNELMLVQDMINEKGGIDIKGQKYRVEVVIEDCKSTLDGVTAAATSLASKGIKFTVGPAAFFASASAPITNRNKILDVLGYNVLQPEQIGPNQPYAFAGLGGAGARALSGIKLLKAKFPQVKNLCMVSPAGGINKPLEAFLRQNLAAAGYNIVGEWVVFPDDATDWSTYAAKINANKQADAVFWLNCITFHVGNMLKSLREIGYDKWVFAWSNAPGADVMKITGPDAAQKLVTQAFTPGSKDNPPELEALMKKSQAKYGPAVPLYFETACPLGILLDMIQKAQSLDPTVVKKKWESMDGQTINSLFGPAVISGTKTYGIKGHGLSHGHPNQMLDKGVVTDAGWFEAGPLP
jgi:branched-chain amino acid transport system substrate-binding protein